MGGSIRTIAGLAGLTLASLSSAAQYLWDDGTAEQGIGSSFHQVLAVGFESLPNQETITSIQFFNFSNQGRGHAVNYHLWITPPEGGNLLDATLVQTVATTIDAPQSSGGNWQSVDITPTFIPAGTWFYVGVSYDDPSFQFPMGGLDNSSASFGQSWLARWNGPTQPGNISSADLVFNSASSDYLIRANGVPEPTSMVAVAIGVLAQLRRRRR